MSPLGGDRYLFVIGLNPSTADEHKDDPTIRRCIDFAKRWGYSSLCMANLFAWRDTLPRNMKRAHDPIGPENDRYLTEAALGAGLILAAWGRHGSHLNRGNVVRAMIEDTAFRALNCLGYNADGSPKHPLYIPATTIPEIYSPE